jgi:hypothetical protein
VLSAAQKAQDDARTAATPSASQMRRGRNRRTAGANRRMYE